MASPSRRPGPSPSAPHAAGEQNASGIFTKPERPRLPTVRKVRTPRTPGNLPVTLRSTRRPKPRHRPMPTAQNRTSKRPTGSLGTPTNNRPWQVSGSTLRLRSPTPRPGPSMLIFSSRSEGLTASERRRRTEPDPNLQARSRHSNIPRTPHCARLAGTYRDRWGMLISSDQGGCHGRPETHSRGSHE